MSRQIIAEFPFVERFDELSAEFPGAGLDWLDAMRRMSLDRFNRLALPSTRVEAWKYTNLRELAKTPFEMAEASSGSASLDLSEQAAMGSESAHRLVFANGIYDASLSRLETLPDGVIITNLEDALTTHGSLVRPHLERLYSLEEDALLALNTAFMMNGYVVIVEEGIEVGTPIELLFLSDPSSPTSIHPRNLIVAGAESNAKLTEWHVGSGDSDYWSNPVTEVVVGPEAAVSHRKVQRESASAFHLAQTRVSLAGNATYTGFLMSAGARLSRCEVEAHLEGDGANCELDGIYLARDHQHSDITTRIAHTEPGGNSRQVFKGVLDGHSHGVFQGQVSVSPDAQRTDGHQLNKTLLLSEDAEINTKPELEICADDVKCSHGATAGQLDELELFYLRSRGLDAEEARQVLIRAFIAEVVESVEEGDFQDQLNTIIDDWLSNGLSTSQGSDG
ncbi:MAG: Fe-S cluster assembly protein SufD [Alphaproteobacteria bacterium]|nr:Fe-S cluster assembly protein SufD [Alphaproteobacteria bacterium]|tara:strand:+ start:103 stop:1449 length:1347 start_codon:yes stop_codon:yes gene_type:complete